jgi:phosphoribosylpyrophosphate synthetase
MLNFNLFKNIINEGFVIKDDTVYFDSNSSSFINTSFGKTKKLKPFESKIENGVIYSVYNKEKSNDDLYKEVLTTIKGQSTKYKMDYNSYRTFIDRTAIYMSNLILKEKIDTILVMDSSSPLVSDLTLEINRRLPKYYSMYTFNKQIFKTPDIQDITIDTMGIDVSDKNYKSMKSSLDKMKKEGYFKIHNIYAPNRKFIKNWLKINNNVLSKIVDKRVALIDDILTTGSTIKEAARLLNDAGSSYIIGLTIIKGK